MSIEKISRTNRQDNLKKGVWENNYVRMQDLDSVIDDMNDEVSTLTTGVSDNAADIATNAADIAALQAASSEGILLAEVSLTSAQVTSMYATPVEVIPAPGAGQVISVIEAVFILDAGSSPFANGGDAYLVEETSGNALTDVMSNVTINSATDGIYKCTGVSQSLVANKAVQITNDTTAYTAITSDGVLRVKVLYKVLSTGL